MSVFLVGGERFAVGIEWEGELVKGRDASQLGWENGRPWTVDVGGQTGFLDGEGSPGKSRPLAGALRGLWRGEAGQEESWIAAIEEDRGEGDESGQRVAVVRCSRGVLLADGEAVFDTAGEAFEELAQARSETVALIVTRGLADRAPEAEIVEAAGIVEAAADVAVLAEVRAPGRRGQVAKLVAGLVAIVCVGGAGAVYGPGLVELGWDKWIVGKKELPPPPPSVDVVIDTAAFLGHCRDELDRREIRMTGFDRVAVFCRPAFSVGETGAPWELDGRAVLEVRWRLRKDLEPRVYRPLAERMLERWFWAGIRNEGNALAVSPLPRVMTPDAGTVQTSPRDFRGRIDRAFGMRGFEIEYPESGWGAPVEVVLTTDRPFAEAVGLVGSVEGLEVVEAAFAEKTWRFEARRTRPRNMLESAFDALAVPLRQKLAAGLHGKEASDG